MNMKKINILASLLMGAALLVGCEDDNNNNPILKTPTVFVLNEPALGGNVYDLANADGITLTWSQPNYGYTAAVKYYAQVSLLNDFNEAAAGHMPNYAEVEGAATTCKYTFPSNLVDAALLKAGLIDEPDKLPYTTDLYIRLRATVGAAGDITSNVIKVRVKPYYQELSSDPVLWYISGDCIGDGQETLRLDAIGTSLIPLSAVSGAKYNFNGDGEFTMTDYFPAGGKFRLVNTAGVDKETNTFADTNFFGTTDGTAATAGVGNTGYFTVPAAGYYTLTFNSKNSNFSFESSALIPNEYTSISVPGSINGWDVTGNHMTAANNHSGVNHIWYLDLTLAAKDELKFAANDSWGTNWGASDFPYGFGTPDGPNVIVTQKGDYRVFFNDITGFYTFIKATE